MKILEFRESIAPITTPVTKFGGAPVWLATPQWPLSRSTGLPMRFIGQILLPAEPRFGGQRMAYIFIGDRDEEAGDHTWDPNGGENAVILQPGPFVPVVETAELPEGPTLERFASGHSKGKPTELEALVTELPDPEDEDEDDIDFHSQLFGMPLWLQGDETPTDGHWSMILQLLSESTPADLNFGDAGIGYAFVRSDGESARFLWQCG